MSSDNAHSVLFFTHDPTRWTDDHQEMNDAVSFEKDFDKLKSLLETTPDPWMANKDGCTLIHQACYDGEAAMLDFMLEKAGPLAQTLVNLPGKEGSTPLGCASQGNHADFVAVLNILFRYGAAVSINTPDEDGWHPLYSACMDGRMDIISLLLENGAASSINTPIKDGGYAIHTATHRGHLDAVKALISHGADIDVKDQFDNTPLQHAIDRNHLELITLLKK